MAKKVIIRLSYDSAITEDELFDRFDRSIDRAVSVQWIWSEQMRPSMDKAVKILRDFSVKRVLTPEVKGQFAALTALHTEVNMTTAEQWAVYALAGAAHYAAHFGHRQFAASARSNNGVEAHDDYARFQQGYVLLGQEEVEYFVHKIEALEGVEALVQIQAAKVTA
jgi:hypothetical protein